MEASLSKNNNFIQNIINLHLANTYNYH